MLKLQDFACHVFSFLSKCHMRRPCRLPVKRILKLADAKLNVPLKISGRTESVKPPLVRSEIAVTLELKLWLQILAGE